MQMTLTIAVAILGAFLAVNQATACKIERTTAVRAITYDPFSPVDNRMALRITIKNNRPEPCQAILSVTATPPLRFGGILEYNLESAHARPRNASDVSGLSLDVPYLVAGATVSLKFDVVTPRGQTVIAGAYADNLLLTLASQHDKSPLDTVQTTLYATVPPRALVSLAGAGRVTTVDFGQMQAASERTVILETRSTSSYAVRVSSHHQGRLILEGSNGQETASVPYQTVIDGQQIDLAAGVEWPAVWTQSTRTHRLTFRLGETQGRQAGLYKDAIRIFLTPKL